MPVMFEILKEEDIFQYDTLCDNLKQDLTKRSLAVLIEIKVSV